MTLELTPHADRTILSVRAQPGARRDEIRGVHDGALRVAVTAAPEKGKANHAIIKLLAKTLGIAKSRVVLISGETSRNKTFLVHGLSQQKVADALADPLDSA
jgi:uncharacterized protein (TIGR00251 family)